MEAAAVNSDTGVFVIDYWSAKKESLKRVPIDFHFNLTALKLLLSNEFKSVLFEIFWRIKKLHFRSSKAIMFGF